MSDVNDNNNPGDNDSFDDIGDGDAVQPDPVRNLQAEMNRKHENMNQALAQQSQQLEAMLQEIRAAKTPAQQTPKLNYAEAIFDKPEAVLEDMTNKATRAAELAVDRQFQLSNEKTAVINQIQGKYSEFMDNNSAATQLAVKKANSLPQHLRGTPEGLKMAMLDAVYELGLTPTSARANNDNFTIGSGGTGGGAQNNRRQQRNDAKPKVDPATLEFAALLGIDTSDPKRVEGLAKASSRKRWNGYE